MARPGLAAEPPSQSRAQRVARRARDRLLAILGALAGGCLFIAAMALVLAALWVGAGLVAYGFFAGGEWLQTHHPKAFLVVGGCLLAVIAAWWLLGSRPRTREEALHDHLSAIHTTLWLRGRR